MNKSQARFLLRSCRPGGVDAADPTLAEALEAASRDEALGAWFAREQQWDRAVAAPLKEMPVPANLAGKILAGLQEQEEEPVRRRRLAPLALAASLALLAALGLFWALRPLPASHFTHYRGEMVGQLDGRLVLNVQSERAGELQQWLAEARGLHGSVMPAGLLGQPSIGCRTWTWNGQPVGLICFRLEGGQVVHLFVVPRHAVPAAPTGVEAAFAHVGAWETASWTRGDLTYVLAGRMERDALAKLL